MIFELGEENIGAIHTGTVGQGPMVPIAWPMAIRPGHQPMCHFHDRRIKYIFPQILFVGPSP